MLASAFHCKTYLYLIGNLSQVDILFSCRLCDIVLFLSIFKILLFMTLESINASTRMKQRRKQRSVCCCDESDSRFKDKIDQT